MSKAEIRKEIEEQAKIGKGQKCPLTGKAPSEDRCYGQKQMRMLLGGLCKGTCYPKFDDLKMERVRGRASLEDSN